VIDVISNIGLGWYIAYAVISLLAPLGMFIWKRSGDKRGEDNKAAFNRLETDIKDGFRRNDSMMETMNRATLDLAEKVGKQNGRIGRLEEWQRLYELYKEKSSHQ
jgi:hypothetical protein